MTDREPTELKRAVAREILEATPKYLSQFHAEILARAAIAECFRRRPMETAPKGDDSWLQERIESDTTELEQLCQEIPGLREMCGEFQVQFPPTRLYVLKSRDSALWGRSPLELLIAVRDAIRIYGEMGS